MDEDTIPLMLYMASLWIDNHDTSDNKDMQTDMMNVSRYLLGQIDSVKLSDSWLANIASIRNFVKYGTFIN